MILVAKSGKGWRVPHKRPSPPCLGVAYRLYRAARRVSGGVRDFATNIILPNVQLF